MKPPVVDEDSPPRPFRWLWNPAAGRLEPVVLTNRRPPVRAWHWGVVAVLSASGLIYGSLLPFEFRELSFAAGYRDFFRLWAAGAPAGYSKQDVAVNALIAVPLAFSLMGAMLLHRRNNPTRLCGTTLATLVICFGLSNAVEFAQLWIETRVSSLRDIAAQIAGAAVGAGLWLGLGSQLSEKLGRFLKSREPASRVVWLLNAYVIGLLIWSLLPFDLVTSLDELGRKYRRGQVEIVPFTFPFSTSWKFWLAIVSDAVIFIPVGVWSTFAWLGRGTRIRNPWSALAMTVGLNVLLELAQLFVKSRYTSSTDVLMGIAGCGIGIVASQIWAVRRGRVTSTDRPSAFRTASFWAVVSLAYAALLVAVEWAPFDFTRDHSLIDQRLQRFADIPFRALQASGSDVGALFLIIRNFGWYVPLGGLAALAAHRSPWRSRTWWNYVAAAVFVAAVAVCGELGQILLPEKLADLTEAMIRVAGGLAGLATAAAVVNRWSIASNP